MKNQAQTFDEYELGPFRAANEVSDVANSGDIVEIDMVIFSKFAIYVGQGNIVYVTDPDDNNNVVSSNEQLNDNQVNNIASAPIMFKKLITAAATENNKGTFCNSDSKQQQQPQQLSVTPPPQPSVFSNNLRAAANVQLRGRASSTSALGYCSGNVSPNFLFPSVPSGFKCVVRCAPLVEVAANYKCRINNKLPGASQRNLESLPVEQVVQRCSKMVGKEIDFHMLKYNSEYYVTKWKYDCGWSDQASIMKRAVGSLQNSQSMADKHQLLVDNINWCLSGMDWHKVQYSKGTKQAR